MIRYIIFDFNGVLSSPQTLLHVVGGTPPGLVSGVPEMLKNLQKEYELFMASAITAESLDAYLEKTGIKKYFTEILGGPQNKITLVADLLERRGLQPHEGVFIGDGIIDLETAERNELVFVGVAPDKHARAWFEERGVLHLIDSVDTLPNVLQEL